MRKFQISKSPNFHIFLWLHVKNVGLDSLVGGDGESCDVVLPCREGLDRALPADLRMILSEETIGGRIVDRVLEITASLSRLWGVYDANNNLLHMGVTLELLLDAPGPHGGRENVCRLRLAAAAIGGPDDRRDRPRRTLRRRARRLELHLRRNEGPVQDQGYRQRRALISPPSAARMAISCGA